MKAIHIKLWSVKLGAFSVSLSVSNIEESKVFYQKLGFEIVGGPISKLVNTKKW